ncbi:hypothetical protein niasHT_021278 [Heterodera trifolii]|uniref:Uncharacterized protein n=1 Tax=Heterodera trifolii TaxID=157864 RepID=A0ABD2JNG0_9BILA
MSASSSLLLAVALASLVISAYTLKCWHSHPDYFTTAEQCLPGTVLCNTVYCQDKVVHEFIEQNQFTLSHCQQNNSSHCADGTDDVFTKCVTHCCRGDFCNGVPDRRVIQGPTVVYMFFAVLSATIFSAVFVKWF